MTMDEEKNNYPEDDSADDSLEQSAIDELFAGDEPAADDGESSAAESENELEDLDQSAIDALLNGEEDEIAKEEPEADSSSLPDEEGIEEETVADLDQESIDALFAAGGQKEQEESLTDSDELGDLDQSAIDALLGGEDEKEEPGEDNQPAEGSEEDDNSEDSEDVEEEKEEFSQESIDTLFAGQSDSDGEGESPQVSDEKNDEGEIEQDTIEVDEGSGEGEAAETSSEEEAQEEIDSLFASSDISEETDSADGTSSSEEEEEDLDELFASLEEDEEEKSFLGDEFNFAEEIDSDNEEAETLELDEKEDLQEENDKEEAREDKEKKITAGNLKEWISSKDWVDYSALEPYLKDKRVITCLGGFVVIFITLLFLLSGDEGKKVKEKITVAKSQSVNETQKIKDRKKPERKSENFIPVAKNENYRMAADGGNIEITLQALDQDDDNLTFVITKEPEFGRLSGSLPHITYLPSTDFSGADSFRFKVEDGNSFSSEATVLISGPNLAKQAAQQEKKRIEASQSKPEIKEEENLPEIRKLAAPQPPVHAPDITLVTKSTESVILDLATLWGKGNLGDYNKSVYCQLDAPGIRGDLQQIGQSVYRYKSDSFFSGIEIISYRFKKGGISSPVGTITIKVTLGDPPPVLALEKMERKEYAVGETVIIDASPSRDDERRSLKFNWEQVSGVPVLLRKENKEGSRISFIMPSDFSNRRNPGPLFKISVTDASGQKVSKFIKTRSVSLRNSALR